MSRILRFDCYEVDLDAGQIRKGGIRLRLSDQPFRVLAALLEQPGEPVTREELRRRLWRDEVFVDFEAALNTDVAKVREVLGDSAAAPRFIETLPKRGYRFIAPVSEAAAVAVAPTQTSTTADPIAYREYALGRRDLESFRTPGEIVRSIEHLQKAIAHYPNFGLAHEALALLYYFQGYCGLMAPRDAFSLGVLHAVRAMEIDTTRAEAYALLAHYRKQIDYDWAEIERELARARELGPNSPVVSLLYSMASLMPQGRLQEAIAVLQRAARLDPLSMWIHTWLAVVFALARDADSAAEEARCLIELDAGSPWGYWSLGFALRAKGRTDESIAAHRKAAELSGDSPMMLGWLGLALCGAGRQDEVRELLERLQAMSRVTYVPPTSFAWLHLGLRQLDAAFEWLDRAVEARDQFMMPIKSYPFFDPIRGDPRFAALLRKMKLEA